MNLLFIDTDGEFKFDKFENLPRLMPLARNDSHEIEFDSRIKLSEFDFG